MRRVAIIDYLKTISIILIILYHLGMVQNGYLGVELFFVVAGYLFAKSNKEKLANGLFNPVGYTWKRVKYFLPLLVNASLISLVMGFFLMLPNDYENLSESVIASNLFLNNILQEITTKNYWDVVNMYKPLMHTWYIATLVQIYFFIGLVLCLVRKIKKKDSAIMVFLVLTVLSLLAFFAPFFQESDRFYFFFFRIFEFGLGAMMSFSTKHFWEEKIRYWTGGVLSALLLLIICVVHNINSQMLLLITVIFGAIILKLFDDLVIGENKWNYFFSLPGKYSFEIYVWHQVIIAFLFYSVFEKINIIMVLIVFAVTILLSSLSVCIRKKSVLHQSTVRTILVCEYMITFFVGVLIYINAGVVRDIPELDIKKSEVHRNMHAEYVDIPYEWDSEFENPEKINVLVVGNSFARDFANILNESEYSDFLEISYRYGNKLSEINRRVEEADLIFYASDKDTVPKNILKIEDGRLYIVGNKNFGSSNGIFYAKRGSENYYNQTALLDTELLQRNGELREQFGDHYIDMITPLLDDNRIRIFTDDHYFISQDCRHLTKQGAVFYAKKIDLSCIRDLIDK